MFTDHMFFSGAIGMLWVLAMLTSFAMSYRVRFQKTILLHPAPGSSVPPETEYFSTLRNCSVRSSNHFSAHFRYGAQNARKNRDLFPRGRRAPANGKEDTSC